MRARELGDRGAAVPPDAVEDLGAAQRRRHRDVPVDLRLLDCRTG
jgi:hypothetical protein